MKLIKSIIAMAAALDATIGYAGDSSPFRLDTMEGTRIARAEEVITYSTEWDNAGKVIVAVDGVTLKEASAPASGDVTWNARNASVGNHTLTHTAYKNGVADKVESVTFTVKTFYTVTFNANGGSLGSNSPTRSITEGNTVGTLPTLSRTGYTFVGWFTAVSGGTQISASTTVSGNVTYYAHWTVNQYTVTFDANGAAGTMADQPMTYDVPARLSALGFSKGDSYFCGWAKSAGGTVAYPDGALVTNLTAVADDVVPLYAVWQKKPASVLACEDAFGGAGTVSLDEDGNIVVTLTNDVSGTVELPDNVGAVTIDLNGHDMVGYGGGLGETALPGGPAILIVAGEGEGDATRLAIVDTSDGETGQIAGGGESAGIEVAEDAAYGVRLDVEEGVTVLNGDGTEQEVKPRLVGTGTVTVPKSWKVGQKVTWKAKADKGSVFARWEGALVDSLNLTRNERRNPSLAFAVPEGFETNMVTAVFIPLDDDGLYTLGITQTEFGFKEAVSDVCVTDDSHSYVTATASGLPSGLKFDAKKMCITGAPTKGGVYWVQIKAKNASGYQWAENVKVTVSGDGKEAKEPKLTRTAYHPLTVICATEGGTVSGTGVYAEGKKVTIKATAAKGHVFAGWYEDSRLMTPATFATGDFRTASQNVVVSEMRYVFARFVTVDEDNGSISAGMNGVGLRLAEDGSPYQTNVMCGVALRWPIAVEALSLPTVAVAGLPTGLKFTAKDVVDSKTKQVTVPANTIYGAPTAASKVDTKTGVVKPSVVNVTVTTASKAKVVYEIDVTVDAMPEWAVGTFDGYVRGSGTLAASGEEGSGEGSDMGVAFPKGLATVTVAANGKISGKVIDADGTWTLSAASFDSYDAESETYVATVIGKNGKMAITNEVEVAAEEMRLGEDASPHRRGVVTGGPQSSAAAAAEDGRPPEWTAWQNLWKRGPWKTDAKPFAKAPALAIDAGTRDACPYPGTVTLKFAASGAVTASGKFVTGQDAKGKDVVYSASCSSVLVPEADAAGAGRPPYRIFLYFPPKAGKFEGYADEVSLEWDGAAFGAVRP